MSNSQSLTALLLMDLQNEMVSPEGKFGQMGLAKAVKERAVLENSARILGAFRTRALPVVFIRLGFRADYADALSVSARVEKLKSMNAAIVGTWGTEFPSELAPHADEVVFTKQGVNPFFNTSLLSWLSVRGIRRLALCGVATNNVVESAARYADDAGFAVTTVEDCCASAKPDWHKFAIENTLPMYGKVGSADAFIATLEK